MANLEAAKLAMAEFWGSGVGSPHEIAELIRETKASTTELRWIQAWLPPGELQSTTGTRLVHLERLLSGLLVEAQENGGRLRGRLFQDAAS